MCGTPLDGCGFPLPKRGKGRCPRGGIDFAFELEIDESDSAVKKDKQGQLYKEGKWKIAGDVSNHK